MTKDTLKEHYQRASIIGDFWSLVAGGSLALAFAPFHLSFLAVLSPAMLLACWQHCRPRRAFLRGYLYGLGMFAAGTSWVYVSIHRYGNADVSLSLLITGGMIAFLALFPAFQGLILNAYFRKRNFAKCFLAFPALWVLFEWFRSWIFTGFPWLYLGYSQIDSPLSGVAPLGGVYGVSWICALCAAFILRIVLSSKSGRYFNTALVVTLVVACYSVKFIPWTQAQKDSSLKVSLVQGNIPQEMKWQRTYLPQILQSYWDLSANHQDSDLIVWPEAAMPIPLPQGKDYLDRVDTKAKELNMTYLIGVPIESSVKGRYYNALVSVGENEGHYLKNHLVPFGEYTPFEKILKSVLSSLQIPMSDFISGPPHQALLDVKEQKVAPLICYEIAFPEQVRLASEEANLIVTISDDSWFGSTIGPHQHLEIARMRALETGRPVLRATNTGLTAVIDAKGEILAEAPQFKRAVLNQRVVPYNGMTPWLYFGSSAMLILMLALLGLAYALRRNAPWQHKEIDQQKSLREVIEPKV